MPTDQINVRIDAKTKQQAESVLEKIGLAPSDAVRMFYKQIVMRQGLPFAARIEKPVATKSKSARATSLADTIKQAIDDNLPALRDLANR